MGRRLLRPGAFISAPIVLRKVSKDSLLTFLITFSYHSIMLCLFFMNFPFKKGNNLINWAYHKYESRTKSGSAYNTPSVPFYIFFFSWCEIYYQQRVYIGRVGNSCDQWVKIGRIGENCGDYELSKVAGSRKSFWVHFLAV